MSDEEIGAVVLAAGRSRRMGREKALLVFGESTALERILSCLEAAGVSSAGVCVVLRADLTEAARRAEKAGAWIAVNPNPDGEMLDSIRIGVTALPSSLDAFFVWPVDHPLVSATSVRRLAEGADRRLATIPTFRTRRGHPALVGMGLREDLLSLPPGVGLRELWRAKPEALRERALDDPGVVANVDTPEQYAEALRLFGLS